MEKDKPIVCLYDDVKIRSEDEPIIYTQRVALNEDELQDLKHKFRVVTLNELSANNELLNQVKGLALSNNPAAVDKVYEWIPRLPNLQAIASLSAGYDYGYPKLRQFGIPYSNCPDAHTEAVADHAMSMVLATGCGLMAGMRAAQLKKRPHYLSTTYRSAGVCDATLGIVGLGSIGLAVARKAIGFRMKLLYCGRTRKSEDIEKQLRCTFCSSIDEMLPLCDFLVLCCALNEDTAGLIGEKQFKVMRESASLINVARGKVVDTMALVEALKSGQIGQAALDVTDPDPLPSGHPLLELNNVIITPHSAALTSRGIRRCFGIATKNLEAALIEGKPMPNEISL